jgi:hypothetical protein
VFDVTGKVICMKELDANKFNSVPMNVNDGMYLYQIISGQNQVSGKFIVK